MLLKLYGRLPLMVLAALWAASLIFVFPLAHDAAAQFRPGPAKIADGPCDFVMFYAAGQLAAAGAAATVYDIPKLEAQERANKANTRLTIAWFYPPAGLLLPRLAGNLPFFPAFLLWDLGLLALAVLAARRAAYPWPVLAAVAVSPAGLLNLYLGQFGLLTGALLAASFVLAEAAPAWSGAFAGALIFRPQAALLAPVVLLARGKISGLAAGALTAAGISLLTLVLFGPDLWRNFLAHGVPVSHAIVIAPFPSTPPPVANSNEFYGISVFWMCRSFRMSVGLSYAAQALASLGAVALCWRAWRRPPANRLALIAFTASLAMLATPYGYVYDLCAVCLPFAALAWAERRLTLTDALLWGWPVLGLLIAFHAYLELAPVILCLSAWRAARAMRA
jgi:hypothetical protein